MWSTEILQCYEKALKVNFHHIMHPAAGILDCQDLTGAGKPHGGSSLINGTYPGAGKGSGAAKLERGQEICASTPGNQQSGNVSWLGEVIVRL